MDAGGNDISDEDLVRRNIGWMHSLASRLLGDAVRADDAVQMAFARILAGRESFEGRSSLKTWMHRILVNEAIGILRREARLNEEPIEHLLPQFDTHGCRIAVLHADVGRPEDHVVRGQTREILLARIEELPEIHAIVLKLRDIEGLSTREVADMLELTETNVKVRLHRARSALKTLLEPLYREGAL